MELLTTGESAAGEATEASLLLEEHVERMTALRERVTVAALLAAHGVVGIVACELHTHMQTQRATLSLSLS